MEIILSGKTMKNYVLKEERWIPEIDSKGKLFEHKQTGARIFCLESDDDNNVFSIAFKTPVKDNKGIPHILEHSVLCGSKNFPIKDPFREILSSSLKTFLNAITYPDRTIYPIASRNQKDFFNLMNVYLDAVFYPKIYEREEIFKQEGWNYSLDNPKSDLRYNGVVYNEMKGVLSSPENVLVQKIKESLYPNTQYAKEFGGDPKEITKLKYKDFLKYHEKHYHPSNSYIFFYGNGDMQKNLEFLHEKYLKNFKRKKYNSILKLPKKPRKTLEIFSSYAISKEEKRHEKTFLSLNFSVGKSTNMEISLAFQILFYALLIVEGAPLKEELIKNNLGKNVSGFFDDDILPTYFTIIIKNAKSEDKDRFQKLVFEKLKEIVEKGIDEDLIKGAINRLEFMLKEADFGSYPKGLIYNLIALKSWIYDEDPFVRLEFKNILEKIKKDSTKGYFENLIKKFLLENPHRSLVVLEPSKTLATEKEVELKRELEDYKVSLEAEEIMDLFKETVMLKNYQNAPDKQEDLEKIPRLSLNDVDKKISKISRIEKNIGKTKILYHHIPTNDIIYLELIFDTKHISIELIQHINLISLLFKKLNTRKKSYAELNNLLNKYTGGIGFFTETFSLLDKKDNYRPKFVVKAKCFKRDFTILLNLIEEILLETNFEKKKRIKEILQEKKSEMESKIISSGHSLALNRLCSYFSDVGKYLEYTNGLSFYNFLKDLDLNFEKQWNVLQNDLINLNRDLFDKDKLIVNITCEDDLEKIEEQFSKFLSKLDSKNLKDKKYKIKSTNMNEGLAIQTDVQYVAKGFDFKSLGYKYSGELKVLENLITNNYFWNNIRLIGGAYGAMSKITRDGKLLFVSSQDPHIRRTLEVYDGLGDSLKKLDLSTLEKEKMIIGAISELDKPLTASMKGEISVRNYIIGIDDKFLQRERDEILKIKNEDFNEFAEIINKAMQKNYYCVVGNRNKLIENEDLFSAILDVFK
jgi:presequence protease